MQEIIAAHQKEYALDAGQFVSTACAPGRIHYMGENGLTGKRLMLSSAIDKQISVAASLRTDGMYRFYWTESEERKRAVFANLRPRREDRWANFIKAAMFVYIAPPDSGGADNSGGLSFTIKSTMPKHKGFGANSALELAAALALRPIFAPGMSDDELVSRLAASHKSFFERNIDNVDFYVMMAAKQGMWTLTDENRMRQGLVCTRNIKTPFDGYKTIVYDSRVPLFDSQAEAEKRASQLEAGLLLLNKRRSGTNYLSTYAVEILEAEKEITEGLRRRCLHVAGEAARLAALEEAMEAEDIPLIAKIFQQSQISLRDQYEVTCPEVDWLVRRAEEVRGVAASRMIGPGFGSTTFAILNEEAEKEYKTKLEDYERIFGFHPHKYEIQTGNGAKYL